MKPLIHPRDYCAPATFAKELEDIFFQRWICAGVRSQLAAHQDYRCIDIGGVSVILQNFEGQIKAFNNVCSHRFARLQPGSAGNRELICPYHGWRYNQEGLPHIVPKRPTISELSAATLCDYRLSRWHVRTFGPMVFIKKQHAGQELPADDLERQFAAYSPALLALGAACGELVENTEYRIKANWKVVVENTLEGYHVDCVHPESIGKLGIAGLSPRGAGDGSGAPAVGSAFTFAAENSAVFSPLDPELSARMDRAYRFLAQRPQRLTGYQHYYCFPNFVSASTRGESFSLQRILPIDESTTQLTSYFFATNGLENLSKLDAAMKRQFYKSAGDFVRQIFSEDVGICEQVQSSVGFAHGQGVLSDEEERICAFHRAYQSAMVLAGS